MPQPTTQNKEMNLEPLSLNQLCAIYDALTTAEAEGTHTNPELDLECHNLLTMVEIAIDTFRPKGQPFSSFAESNNPYSERNGFTYR